MQPKCKVWLENGQPLFGDGGVKLLRSVERKGSIRQAAAELGMSYRQAWAIIGKIEKRMGIKFLIRRVGGETGGGAQLTEDGKKFIVSYDLFREEVDKSVAQIFSKYFKD